MAILSRHPLLNVRPLAHPGGDYGVRAETVIDGRRFVVASVHLSATFRLSASHARETQAHRHTEVSHLIADWRRDGEPPMIVAGDFNQLPFGKTYRLMTEHLADVLAGLGRTEFTFHAGPLRSRIDYVLTSRDWTASGGGVVATEASDHNLIWAKLEAATRP